MSKSTPIPEAGSTDPWLVSPSMASVKPLEPESHIIMQPWQVEQLEATYQVLTGINPEAEPTIREILERGTMGGKEIGCTEVRGNGSQEARERVSHATLEIMDPETAEKTREVAGYHVTASATLGFMLERTKGALVSATKRRELGIATMYGSGDTRIGGGQKSISFSTLSGLAENVNRYGGSTGERTHDDVLADYATKVQTAEAYVNEYGEHMKPTLEEVRCALEDYSNNPDSLSSILQRYQFPIGIGVNTEFVRSVEAHRQNGRLLQGSSGMDEFRPAAQEIPFDQLTFAIPRANIADIAEIFRKFGLHTEKIVPLESLLAAGAPG